MQGKLQINESMSLYCEMHFLTIVHI